jgi:hypothetical protein
MKTSILYPSLIETLYPKGSSKMFKTMSTIPAEQELLGTLMEADEVTVQCFYSSLNLRQNKLVFVTGKLI